MHKKRQKREIWSVRSYFKLLPAVFEEKLASKLKRKWQHSLCTPHHDGEYDLTLYIDNSDIMWYNFPFKIKVIYFLYCLFVC